jgi:hypothetical protein
MGIVDVGGIFNDRYGDYEIFFQATRKESKENCVTIVKYVCFIV